MMCVDHAEELGRRQVLSYFTYAPVGVATAAELFIFLSGVSLGLACLPILERRGYLLTHARCAARAWQLYLLHVLALVLTVAVITRLPMWWGLDPAAVPLSESIRTTNRMLGQFVLLRANPQYFDILPLYIVLLLALPTLFPLLRRSWRQGLLVAGGVYLAFHAARVIFGDAAMPFSRTLYYNPIAWQLLFTIGMAIGVRMRLGLPIAGLSGRRLWVAVAILVVIAAWYKGARINVLLGLFGDAGGASGDGVPYDVPLIDKPTLGPIRLLQFLLLASVVAAFCPRDAKWLRAPWAAPVVQCGRNALEVFVFGIIATYAAGVMMQVLDGGRLTMVGLDAAAIAGSIGLAYLVGWRKREPWRS